MTKKIFLFLTILNFHFFTYSCECYEVSRDSAVEIGVKYSDLVFTGELLEAKYGEKFKFKINEVFKGDYERRLIWGEAFNNCSVYPTEKGLWIVYANMKNDSTININGCLHSLPLNKAEGIITPFPESSKGNIADSLKYVKDMLSRRAKGIELWISDYVKLRNLKKESSNFDLKAVENSDEGLNVDNDSNDPSTKNITIGLSILLNIILLGLVIKKRKGSRY